jgi:hypothetical protein
VVDENRDGEWCPGWREMWWCGLVHWDDGSMIAWIDLVVYLRGTFQWGAAREREREKGVVVASQYNSHVKALLEEKRRRAVPRPYTKRHCSTRSLLTTLTGGRGGPHTTEAEKGQEHAVDVIGEVEPSAKQLQKERSREKKEDEEDEDEGEGKKKKRSGSGKGDE